jgi:hypothetical protein
MGTGALSLGVKRLERAADHSPHSSAEIKNACSYTSTPQYVFIAWRLVKHRDNFTFADFKSVFPNDNNYESMRHSNGLSITTCVGTGKQSEEYTRSKHFTRLGNKDKDPIAASRLKCTLSIIN